MSGNLASLRSNPDLSAPMTPFEMERQLMHLEAKVRMLEAQAKWFVTRDAAQRLILRSLRGESRRGVNQHTKSRNDHEPQSIDSIQSMIDSANEDQLILVAELIQQAVEKAAKDLPSREPRLSKVIIDHISDQCRRRMCSFRSTWSHRYRALEERLRKLEAGQ